mmetsp:Transcript_61282/g.182552  ORF Transcript_61282/g.182552 Transcript_61282/m.182552 type:complete len:200 (-) Transcript_61282:819-1418(-)
MSIDGPSHLRPHASELARAARLPSGATAPMSALAVGGPACGAAALLSGISGTAGRSPSTTGRPTETASTPLPPLRFRGESPARAGEARSASGVSGAASEASCVAKARASAPPGLSAPGPVGATPGFSTYRSMMYRSILSWRSSRSRSAASSERSCRTSPEPLPLSEAAAAPPSAAAATASAASASCPAGVASSTRRDSR